MSTQRKNRNSDTYLILTLIFYIFSFTFSIPSSAFPLIIKSEEMPYLEGAIRKNLIAFSTANGTVGKKIPLQIEEVEDGVALIFRAPNVVLPARKNFEHPGLTDPFDGRISKYHRYIFDEKDFQFCDAQCLINTRTLASELCEVDAKKSLPQIVKIDALYKKQSAFIVDCQKFQEQGINQTINIDIKNRIFSSENFAYHYKSEKSVIPRSIKLNGETFISNSEIVAKLKPKKFFNFGFKDDDIQSVVTSVTSGPVGTGVEVAFALKFMGVKVGKQVCCDISIYNDALYLPIMIQLPFDGDSFQDGSGVLLGLDIAKELLQTAKVEMNRWNEKKSLTPNVLAFKQSGRILAVGLRSSKAKNNPPVLMSKENLKSADLNTTSSEIGIFYDVTKLNKGFHSFDVWFYVGQEKDEALLMEYASHGVLFTITRI